MVGTVSDTGNSRRGRSLDPPAAFPCLPALLAICYSGLFSTSGNNSVVECDLAKVEVAGSNPVSRSNFCIQSSNDRPPVDPTHHTQLALAFERRRRQVVRQRSAKPPSPVQIRAAPPISHWQISLCRLCSEMTMSLPVPFLSPPASFAAHRSSVGRTRDRRRGLSSRGDTALALPPPRRAPPAA